LRSWAAPVLGAGDAELASRWWPSLELDHQKTSRRRHHLRRPDPWTADRIKRPRCIDGDSLP